MLVLRMDHGRPRQDGPSLARRILRQYGYVQSIPRPPTDIEVLAADDVADAFTEFALHVLSLHGEQVPDNQLWAHTRGYMRWFVTVSHPIVNPLRPFLIMHLLSLLTRRLLLSSSGPDIL